MSWEVKYYFIKKKMRLLKHRYIGPRLEKSQYSKKRIPVILWKK